LYDNLTLKDVSGKLIVKDQAVTLQNVKTNIFDGLITANGTVSTKSKVPTFAMELGLNQVDIQKSFTQLEMLKNIAPIAGIINGKINSKIHLNGNLDAKEMTPDLKTLTGDLFGQLLSTTVNAKNSTLLSALGSNIKFIDISKINLNDLKANLTFKDGKVNVKPIDLKYQDIKVTVGGSHGFDQSMNYDLKFNVPAKYLGSEVTALLAKLTPAESAKLENIPVNAMVTGNFGSPKISTDMKQAVTNLANQLVKQQKDKLINQGTNALQNIIKGNSKPKDSTKTPTKEEAVKDKAKDLINGLFGGKKK
ncbi:AsmA-like C-terminal region-containing protein, partial [Flavobacterium sp.]|uniref:AsmA-like C-terminal region-containing protein n=1 Tax=Flavobacterium sp. TaxID=239 RepID=UPI0037C04329